jgi:hypothetical protein
MNSDFRGSCFLFPPLAFFLLFSSLPHKTWLSVMFKAVG